MRFGKARWWSLVLVVLMLLSCVAQAEVAPTSTVAPASRLKPMSGSTKSIPSMYPGTQVIYKGKSVTYKIAGPFQLIGNKLVAKTPVSKASVSSVSMSPTESIMGLVTTYNIFSRVQPLGISVKPSNATFSSLSISSTDYNVIDFVSMDGWPGLYAVGPGTATVKVTINKKTASKKITVNPANKPVLFSSMSIGEMVNPEKCVTLKSKSMYAGNYTRVLAQPKPYTATYYDYSYFEYYSYRTSAVDFTSSNDAVASVDEDGIVFAKKPGSATISATARDGSKKKGSFKLTVKAKNPDSFKILQSTLTLNPGTSDRLYPDFKPYDYYDQKVTWSSNAPTIAKVDSTGLVTAIAPGVATITAKTNTGKLPGTCVVTVGYSKTGSETKYRFYGIGNNAYGGELELTSCINDVRIMAAAAQDAGFEAPNVYTDLTGNGIYGALLDIAFNSNIDDNDVTVFYYSGHGAARPYQSERGALCGIDDTIVTVDEVQSLLELTTGTVIVILDSCLSGQFISSKSTSPAALKAEASAFNNAWTSAFEKKKASKTLTDSPDSFRFKILTAASALQTSSGGAAATGFGWFTKWAAKGLGRNANISTGNSTSSGQLPADIAPADSAVTMNELYNYIKTNLPLDTEYQWWNPLSQQHVQMWPVGDKTAIVNKNP